MPEPRRCSATGLYDAFPQFGRPTSNSGGSPVAV